MKEVFRRTDRKKGERERERRKHNCKQSFVIKEEIVFQAVSRLRKEKEGRRKESGELFFSRKSKASRL